MIGRPRPLLLSVLLSAASSCTRAGVPAQPAVQASVPGPTGRGQLAHVRPPPPPCPGAAHGRPQLLVERAEVELDGGDAQLALVCADEALRSAPRLVAALHVRALALTALQRLEEARFTYAHALAVDPDDPETLEGAADLYVSHMDGDRPSLELGVEYALRGARVAQRARHRDGDLVASLFLLAATAENDLGENVDALAHADDALRAKPRDPDALYERGVALYELCRFGEARAAFDAMLSSTPDDPWALHYLGLVAERTGDTGRAAALERRAREVAPDEIPPGVDIDRKTFEYEVRRAVASLPEAERRALHDVPVEVADIPSLDDLTAIDPPLSPSILGLYRGPPERQPCLPDEGPHCRSIVFYRRNLARFAKSRADLDEQVRVTLLHELGHLHGESDEDLRARGLE